GGPGGRGGGGGGAGRGAAPAQGPRAGGRGWVEGGGTTGGPPGGAAGAFPACSSAIGESPPGRKGPGSGRSPPAEKKCPGVASSRSDFRIVLWQAVAGQLQQPPPGLGVTRQAQLQIPLQNRGPFVVDGPRSLRCGRRALRFSLSGPGRGGEWKKPWFDAKFPCRREGHPCSGTS